MLSKQMDSLAADKAFSGAGHGPASHIAVVTGPSVACYESRLCFSALFAA